MTHREPSVPAAPGRFIVLEGLDGAGTTTQTRELHRHYTSRGRDSYPTCEPTAGPIGTFIRTLLAGRAGVPAPSQRVLALLFAGDRLAHTEEIESRRSAGVDVICDRYIFSSLAYQTLDPAVDPEWVADVNRGCATPDLTIFLDVPVATCLERISARNEDRTIYERKDHLETIVRNYTRLRSFYEERFGKLVTIDGARSQTDVQADIRSLTAAG